MFPFNIYYYYDESPIADIYFDEGSIRIMMAGLLILQSPGYLILSLTGPIGLQINH
jgi:hypothetical protein